MRTKGSSRLTMAIAVLVLLLTAAISHANLITNGGFETGDLTGWTSNSNGNWTSIVSGAHSGSYAVALAENHAIGSLSQTIATTPGQDYRLSFFLYNSGASQNLFQAAVNNNILLSQGNLPYQEYTEYNLLFTADSLLTSVLFNEMNNYPDNYYFDDVDVSAVPEPATLLLLGSGIAGMMGMGWRRKKFAC